MKESITLETNEHTSLVSAMAEKLLAKLMEHHQSYGTLELELVEYSATITMTIEITL